MSESNDPECSSSHCRRRLRLLIITAGGRRREDLIQLMGAEHDLVFSPAVPSRSLRNRQAFLKTCHQAGLLPAEEWQAVESMYASLVGTNESALSLEECLMNVPVVAADALPEFPRRGSPYDVSMHYTVELWRKAKTINRGRSVMACILAHLIAMKTLVDAADTDDAFDAILEDNIRPCRRHDFVPRIVQAADASREWERVTGKTCHLRYVGWLGSLPNLEWMFTSHIPKRKLNRDNGNNSSTLNGCNCCKITTTVAPFPTTQDIDKDLLDLASSSQPPQRLSPTPKVSTEDSSAPNASSKNTPQDSTTEDNGTLTAGGTPVWGQYGYWISKQGYQTVLNVLRSDVGAMLWKSKRMRFYHVKPIDKIVPRAIMAAMDHDDGPDSVVHVSTQPAVFRAPMLASKIHSQWDVKFCQSTTYQLAQMNMSWDNLLVTEVDTAVVEHYKIHGEWKRIEDDSHDSLGVEQEGDEHPDSTEQKD